MSPLILASKNGHEKCVKYLLQQPHVNVTIQDTDGYNCLALAALNRHLYVHCKLHIVNRHILTFTGKLHWLSSIVPIGKKH